MRMTLSHIFGGSLVAALIVVSSPETRAAQDQLNLLAGMEPGEIRRLGERMYRDGLLSDGTPLQGSVRGDIPVDSTMFSCSNCHTRSGVGSIEGQVVSPPINGKTLFKPRYHFKDNLKNVLSEKKGMNYKATPVRPAYTDETLAEAILGGINPNGREFSPIMPRYDMGKKDMQILSAYLRGLSSEYSPGVTESTLRLATIISDDVSPADRDTMLLPLERFVTQNRQAAGLKKTPQYAKMGRMLDEAFYRTIIVDRWELKGPSSTWRAQLEEYNRREPVFAILGGMTGGEWQPIHDFCEEKQIPNFFPITDFPVISESNWYTFYFSKGYYQEGEAAARFIAGSEVPERLTLQVVAATREGEALAAGFDAAWKETSRAAVETVVIPSGQKLDRERLQQLMIKYRPTTVVLWGGPEIAELLLPLDGDKASPERVFVSGRYLDKAIYSIPEKVRDRIYITYPYRLPEEEKKFESYASTFSMRQQQHKDEKRIASRMFSMLHVFNLGVREMKLDFYRDALIDVISMRSDQNLPDFERLSFGPGQRYASKGCYIVQLEKGEKRLIKKSEWVVF